MSGRAIKCRLLLADLAEQTGRSVDTLEHVEEAERLARQTGGEVWVDALERLISQLRTRGQRDRIQLLTSDAIARLGPNADTTLRDRVAVLASLA